MVGTLFEICNTACSIDVDSSNNMSAADVVALVGRKEITVSDLQKPGENPDRPGEFVERGPRGRAVPNPRQVTIEPKDERLPPTQEPGRKWEWVSPPNPTGPSRPRRR